jgi:hypothetical protein
MLGCLKELDFLLLLKMSFAATNVSVKRGKARAVV